MPTISEVENHPRYLFKLTDSPSPEHHVLIKKEYDLESTTNVNAVNNNSHVVIQGFNLKSPFTEEPLDLSTLKSRKRKTHSNCGARNCCHQRGSSLSNTEVLLNPELFLVDGSASTNPLLEMCLDGGLRAEKRPKLEPLSPLLESCSAKRFDFYQLQALKERLRQIQGCDINQVHGQQESALHLLIKGCSKETYSFVVQGIYLLLLKGISVDLADSQGNTALTSVRQLLDIQAYSEALHLTTILIQAGTNLNHVNHEDKTILSYSVTHGDASSDLTRLLLNHGAKVWPSFNLTDSSNSKKQQCEIVEHLTKEREQSAFTWFLKNVMEKYSLANMDKTIFLLSSSMGEDPARMQNHIMRVMMHYGHKSTKAFGPMFQEIKQRMSAFWTQPQPLRYLCLKQIRKSIGPKNLSDDECMQTLNVPNTMLQYLQLGK